MAEYTYLDPYWARHLCHCPIQALLHAAADSARRQVMVIPISLSSHEYAGEVRAALRAARLQVEVDCADKTMQKKVFEAQVAQYNYILVRPACLSQDSGCGCVNLLHGGGWERDSLADSCPYNGPCAPRAGLAGTTRLSSLGMCVAGQ